MSSDLVRDIHDTASRYQRLVDMQASGALERQLPDCDRDALQRLCREAPLSDGALRFVQRDIRAYLERTRPPHERMAAQARAVETEQFLAHIHTNKEKK